ncbi:MAG: DivIVA domain-containing protein [Opitutaceae bacterium]|nr:DivIVA domain-containing protein [Cytophagales bacterium]
MKITPLEIRQKTFEKNFRGYDKEEVDAYLLALSQEWERVMEESKELKLKVLNAEKEVQKLRDVETTLYKALKTAEDTGVNIVGQANKTAELLTKESQMNAEAILSEARTKARYLFEDAEEKVRNVHFQAINKVNEIVIEIKSLESQKQNLVQEMKQMANSLLDKANIASANSHVPDFNKMLFKEEFQHSVPKPEPVKEEIKKERIVEKPITIEEKITEVIEEELEEVIVLGPKKITESRQVVSFFDQIN